MTTKADLIAHFEEQTVLPIDLNEAVAWLLERRIQDEIKFIPCDLDVGKIRGFLHRYRRPKGGWDIDPDDVSNIHYDRTQDAKWINIVCAKELLHILDAARCSTKEEYERLVRRLALPKELKYLLEDPSFAAVDKLGDVPAAALMIPRKLRDLLLPAYNAKIIDDEAVSDLAMIPVRHVRMVMSQEWPVVYDLIMADRTQPDEFDFGDPPQEART